MILSILVCGFPFTINIFNAENSAAFITNARENMISLGVDVPEIRIELQDSPMIQCAREDR